MIERISRFLWERRSSSRWLPAVIALAIVFFCCQTAWACPGCKDSLSANQMNLARGFYYSILFMMSMPFLILFGVGGYFYWQIRKARRALAAQTPVDSTSDASAAVTQVG